MEPGHPRGREADTPPWEQRRREADPEYRTRVLVEELCGIGRGRGFLSRSGRDRRTREIGAELHEMGGIRKMREAHDEVRAELGRGPDRELEMAWDGIGDWLG